MQRKIAAAMGTQPCDLVLKNAYVLNVFTEQIITADVAISGNTIVGVGEYECEQMLDCTGKYLVPGFIDAHMHMESSMVLPNELARVLLQAGTTTIIADPHELVNVGGCAAMDYILDACNHMPMDAYITIPSSVPAADSEHNGAGAFTAEQMKQYLQHPKVIGLGEVMRMQDVCTGRVEMLDKLALFANRPIDGHASGLCGKKLQAYRTAGVQSDHECDTAEQAIERLQAGFSLFLREGSGAKNVETILKGLLQAKIPLENCMFCTDDKQIAEIKQEGHISTCIKKAIALGVRPITAYKMASYHTANYFGLRHLGAIAPGYQADLVLLDNLEEVSPLLTFKNGLLVGDIYLSAFEAPGIPKALLNTVKMKRLQKADITLPINGYADVIEMVPHQLLTNHLYEEVGVLDGEFSPSKTYNKLCVVERHGNGDFVGVAPLKGFGLENGAIACSVSHDSHNMIVAGDNDSDILAALDCVRDMQGGFAVVSAGHLCGSLSLPLCGLMSTKPYKKVEEALQTMLRAVHAMGIEETVDPFITLSFLALPVIPEIRLTDQGLYDVLENTWIKPAADV